MEQINQATLYHHQKIGNILGKDLLLTLSIVVLNFLGVSASFAQKVLLIWVCFSCLHLEEELLLDPS